VSIAAGADDAHAAAPTAAAPATTYPYIGLVTRALAFALDAAVINAVAIVTTAVFTLTFSILELPNKLETVAAARIA